MAFIVQKYGGTSLGTLACIEHVADKVLATKQQGYDVLVVVSAMSGETDRLINLAKGIHENPDPREYDVIISTGEQVSMGLLALALIKRGVKARSYTGIQAKIQTNGAHKKARIATIESKNLLEDLKAGYIPIVAGFQGVDNAGDINTLGRGGSDTTAVAIAAALKADECQIYTDVDGVYTTDPRIVPTARRLNRITFEEMLEMASLGAKVLQNRAVEFAGKYKVPLRVLSTFKEGPGTLVTFDDNSMEQVLVSGIAFNRNEARITLMGIPDVPGAEYRVIGPISAAHIDVDMILQNVAADGKTNLTFTVSRDDYQKTLNIVDNIAVSLNAREIVGDNKIAKLSLIGLGMRSHAGVASHMFETLAKEGINIQLITTSEIKISVVIDEKYLELGVRALHDAFNLDMEPIEEFDPLTTPR
jgi:aspartate kinase